MASSIIHLAITELLLTQRTIQTPDRLRLGAILPDAGPRDQSHLKRRLDADHKMTYALERYRADFGSLMQHDTLYLGYYLHLVQDICFRHFLYETHRWNPYVPGNVEKLHHDYAVSNAYVIARYRLKNDLTLPADFAHEPINRLCVLDAAALLQSLQSYFTTAATGTPFFFTTAMADDFIGEAAALCLQELDALACGGPLLDSTAHAWRIPDAGALTQRL